MSFLGNVHECQPLKGVVLFFQHSKYVPKLLVLAGSFRFLVSLSSAANVEARRRLLRRWPHGRISGALRDLFACFGAQGVFQGFYLRLDDSEEHCHPLFAQG